MLLYHDLGAKVVIVDLPEIISYSSACVYQVFPKARILLPNEIEGDINYEDYDYIFLLPNQTVFLSNDQFDLAINCLSMCEMKKEEIEFYFEVVQRVVKNGGYFFCSNRLRKHPDKLSVPDLVTPLVSEHPGTNFFFNYPWDKRNKDIIIDVNRFRYEWQGGKHITIDRLQKIVK